MQQQPIIYGIPNCDTMKKTFDWLNSKGITYTFHNYKKDGISIATLKTWSKQVDWEILLNKKGTTFKKLDAAVQSNLNTKEKVLVWLSENTSAIKRPVVVYESTLLVGLDAATTFFK
ncbi:MAG: Spx/MgsR family RNA polymerase-binding regulatory protein [Ferruginibacter sp.]